MEEICILIVKTKQKWTCIRDFLDFDKRKKALASKINLCLKVLFYLTANNRHPNISMRICGHFIVARG